MATAGPMRKAFLAGLAGEFPSSWRLVDENAAIEFWLTIHRATAVCGLRLSDATMRHREYKVEHRPASLRPTVAAAMVRLAGAGPDAIVVDPTCGAGTILAEQLSWLAIAVFKFRSSAAISNGGRCSGRDQFARQGRAYLARWDAGRLPLADESVDRIIANPPFGKQLSNPDEVRRSTNEWCPECDRVLQPEGKAVLLASEPEWLRPLAKKPVGPAGASSASACWVNWRPQRLAKAVVTG